MNYIPARAVIRATVWGLLFAAAPTMAKTAPVSPSSPPGAAGQVANPNQIICERQKVLGSRLASRRVCMTRAQWADLQLQDRQEIERVQTRRGMSGQ